jgi:hypothetical protein
VRVGQLEDPLGARIERPVNGMAEPRDLGAGGVQLARDLGGHRLRRGAGRDPLLGLLEQLRARLGRAEYDRAAAEDPSGDRALERLRGGRQRHPSGHVGGHHPVLGDRDQQQVEEEALVLGRLVAGEQQVEVLGEAEPAHQVAGEVAATHLDAVRIGLADLGGGHAAAL